MVLEDDVLRQLAEDSGVVLAAQEVVAAVSSAGLVDLLVVGELHLVLYQLGADVFIIDEGVHNVSNHGGVVGANRSQQPGAAPEVSLRAFADGPVAEAALLRILSVAHGEVVVPGRSKVAHGLAVLEHLSGALVGPDVAGLGVALVGELLSLGHPGLDGVVDLQVVVLIHPRSGNVVGEHTVGSGLGSGHVVALGLGLSGHVVELAPVGQGGLDFGGIIGAQNVLGDGTAVNQSSGAALEGNALNGAVGIGSGLHSVSVSVGEIGDAQRLDILGVIGVGVLLDVVGLGQEQVDLVVIGSGGLSLQGLVQLLLISTAIAGGDDPVYGDTFGNGVVLLEEALELFVPGVDVEDLAFRSSGFRGRRFGGGGSGGSGGSRGLSSGGGGLATGAQGKNHSQCKDQRQCLFHGIFLLQLMMQL